MHPVEKFVGIDCREGKHGKVTPCVFLLAQHFAPFGGGFLHQGDVLFQRSLVPKIHRLETLRQFADFLFVVLDPGFLSIKLGHLGITSQAIELLYECPVLRSEIKNGFNPGNEGANYDLAILHMLLEYNFGMEPWEALADDFCRYLRQYLIQRFSDVHCGLGTRMLVDIPGRNCP